MGTTLRTSLEDKQVVYYDKKRAEGKAHGVALGAVCRKLLIRIYAILKENRVYEARTPQKLGVDS